MAKKPRTTARPHAGHQPSPARRIPIALVFAAAALAISALSVWWWLRAPAAFALDVNADRNVLLVTIDTLRADALGSYGGRALTPNLDRLAAHGARFDFAHAQAVVTLPSHASILTGRYPYEHGIRDNTGYRLRPTEPTAATLLKAQGFATGAFIGGFPLDRRFGLAIGFDLYDDRLSQASSSGETGERERRADAVVTSALDWIGRQSGKWFAWTHVYDPHVTYQPPDDWAARFQADPYLGEVSWTDFALGPLFDRLGAQPRPTLVIVTADHGEGLGDHGELTHSVFAYESTLRVPLIVAEMAGSKPPAFALRASAGRQASSPKPRGVVIETPVRHVDLLPTLLDVVGAGPDAATKTTSENGVTRPGSSLRPIIAAGRGDDRPSYFEAMTATVTRGWAPLRGVIVGREKFIDLPIAELYDLSADPQEARNIAALRTDRGQVMLNALRTFDVAPPGRPRAETPDTIERLRSLGYIGGAVAGVREKYTEADDPKRLIEIEQAMNRAAHASEQGRPHEAIELYRGVIARRPDTEDAYRKLALVYWRTGRPREAIATLELALRNNVTQSEVRIKLGQYLVESGQADRAIALLEQTAGDDPDALIALGNAYQLAGRRGDAMRTFKHLLALDPRNGLAYENIGIVQLQAKDYAGAEASLRRALDVDPNLPGAHTALGVVLATTNRKAEAIDAWARAVAIDGMALDALFNLTINLVAAGRHVEARAYGEQYLATAPPALHQQDIATIRRILEGR
ncbi:MAG TPA: sulfatase-like hydrolase/transferase [Vicinamibacterales bacterium]|nr:sulfatase-like hydrolase/transferase [Vicinamibacterales bacterium]